MSDLISRQAAIDAVGKYLKKDGDVITIADVVDAAVAIGILPSAEPERKKGKWLVHTDKFANGAEYFGYATCSECGDMFYSIDCIGLKPIWDFCPNCGADMRGEDDE